MKTVIELLHQGARAWNDMPYLGELNGNEWDTLSFLEVERQSLAFAACLVIRGLKKGDRVAILSEGRNAWAVAEFGILKAACVPVPLSIALKPADIRARLIQCDAKAILVSEQTLSKIAGLFPIAGLRTHIVCLSPDNERVRRTLTENALAEGINFFFYRSMLLDGQLSLDTKPIAAGNAFGGKPLVWVMREIEKDIREDDTAAIVYGETPDGDTKPIALSHRVFWGNAREAAKIARPTAGWKSLLAEPIDEPFAHVTALYAPLIGGLSVYFADTPEHMQIPARGAPRAIASLRPEILILNTSLLEEIAVKAESRIRGKGAFAQRVLANGIKAGNARNGNGFERVTLGTRIGNFIPWKFAKATLFPQINAIFGKNIECCICKGERLGTTRQQFFSAVGIPIYRIHTLAKGGPIVCANTKDRQKIGTEGTPIAGVTLRIMRDEVTECDHGICGHIVVEGDSIVKVGGKVWTGDYGFIDSDGFLVLGEKPAKTDEEPDILIEKDASLVNT